jgi:hypothetical protein
MTTVEEVCMLAKVHYGAVRAPWLAAVYASLPDTDPAVARRVGAMTVPRAWLAIDRQWPAAVNKVGPAPVDVLRIGVYDPRCGVGMFLLVAAIELAETYAGRLTGSRRRAGRLYRKLLPEVIVSCVYGMDTDPRAVDLARLALSLHTGGRLTPQALRRNIVCGDPAAGDEPPARRERISTVELVVDHGRSDDAA